MKKFFILLPIIVVVYFLVMNSIPHIISFSQSLSQILSESGTYILNSSENGTYVLIKNENGTYTLFLNDSGAYILNENGTYSEYNEIYGVTPGLEVRAGVGDSVSVSIYRPRFWGNIKESNGIVTAYVFWGFPLLLRYKNIDFVFWHLLFIIILGFSVIFYYELIHFMKPKGL